MRVCRRVRRFVPESFGHVSRVCSPRVGRAAVFGGDCVWQRRGLDVSNTFIPLSMADHLQQPEPGDSMGRGPTADHHTLVRLFNPLPARAGHKVYDQDFRRALARP